MLFFSLCYSYFVCGFVVSTTQFHVEDCLALYFRVVSVLFSIVITSLGKERAGLCASQATVGLFCTRLIVSVFISSWCQGFAATCACGTFN